MKIRVDHVTLLEKRLEFRPAPQTWFRRLFRLPVKMQATGNFHIKAYFVVNYMPPLNSVIGDYWNCYRVLDGAKNIILVESVSAVMDPLNPEPRHMEIIATPYREA